VTAKRALPVARRHPKERRRTVAGSEAQSLPTNPDSALRRSHVGLPLFNGDQIMGAIGRSGGTAAQDEQVCKAGVDAMER
jgi:uncharacterized protein GlcG (DUF336 family)